MKKLFFPVAIVATLFLSAFTVTNSMSWKVADDYFIKFTAKNPEGTFKSLKGDIVFDENDLDGSGFNMAIDVTSINTGNGMKNRHAKSAKWFDAEQYPTITFKSSKISKAANGYEVTGMMKIKDVEKEVTFPFNFENNTFKGGFDVNRLDYGIGNYKGMSKNAAKILKIEISVPVTK